MAEEILPPSMAALLAPPGPRRGVDLASLARAGLLGGMPPVDYSQPMGSPVTAMSPPDQYSRPGLRETSGVAAGPQSAQEAQNLTSEPNVYNVLIEGSGMGPAGRSRQAFSEGRPIAGAANAAVAAFPYRPLAASAGAGTTLAAALMGDMLPRLTGSAEAEGGSSGQADIPAEFRPMSRDEYFAKNRTPVKSLADALTEAEARVTSNPAYQGLVEEGKATAARRMVEQARKNAEDAYNKGRANASGEETRLDQGYQKYLSELETQRNKYLTERQSASEYGGAVERAEAARAAELARSRPFDQTLTGQFFNATSGYTPGVVGGATGTILRAAGRPMSSVLPWSIAAGAVTPNWPLASDYYNQPSYNPERRAAEVYLRELPMNHPRRAQYEAMLSGPNALPSDNPIKSAARKDLFDIPQFLERTAIGALEGATGGDLGAAAVDWRRGGGGRDSTGTQRLLEMLGLRRGQQPTATGASAGTATGPASGAATPPNLLATLGATQRRPLPPVETPPPVPTGRPLPTLAERRRDRSYSIPRDAPVAPGEIETWVSPAGNKIITRDGSGNLRDGNRWIGRDPPKGYRRIAETEQPNLLAAYG